MARPKFRVASIILDDDQDVEAVTAVVRNELLPAVRRVLDGHEIETVGRDYDGTIIKLPVWPMQELFHKVGKLVPGNDPDGLIDGGIYDSLRGVVYGLMDG